MIKILKVTVRQAHDEDPDLSWIGKYTDDLDRGVIVRALHEFFENLPDDAEIPEPGREYRGFKPYAGGTKEGTDDYYAYGMQDLEHMEAISNGLIEFIGIHLEAEVIVAGRDRGVVQTIRSGSLWGIEVDERDRASSESSATFINEVIADEAVDLRSELLAFGASTEEIDRAFAECDEVAAALAQCQKENEARQKEEATHVAS